MLLAIDTTQTPQRHHIGLLLTHFSSVDWKWKQIVFYRETEQICIYNNINIRIKNDTNNILTKQLIK